MKKLLLFIIGAIFIISCGSAQIKTFGPEDQAYLDKAIACPLIFTIEKDKIGEAWSRAHVWIAQYSDMKIQVTTDYIIETYNPTATDSFWLFGPAPTFYTKYAYKVLKLEDQSEYKITVQCFSNQLYGEEARKNNAHILAYYIKSSELRPHLIYGKGR
jgi:hypothetical protein